MLLTGADILAARDKKTVEVEVPEWGEGAKVLIGTMSCLDYAELQDWLRSCGRPKEVAQMTAAESEAKDDEPIRVITCDSPAGKPESIGEETPAEPEENTAEQSESEPIEYTFREHYELLLRWAVYCILDPETHERAFGLPQIEALGRKSPAALQRVFEAATVLHHGTEETAKAFLKNSGGTTDGDSGGG